MPIRVLLVDDHALLRDALGEVLEKDESIEVVGMVGTADEAMEQSKVLDPTVILMDIDMPGTICFEAARRIRSSQPDIRVVFLSAYTHDRYIDEALDVGALGYLTKTESPETIVRALHEVAENRVCFSQAILDRLVFDESGPRMAAGGAQSRARTLTNREVEILRYLARGLGKKEIGHMLHVSTKTIDKHTENLMRKLDIHDRVELARYAIREGLAEV